MRSPLHVVLDSGVPAGLNDYISLIIIHGHLWQGGVFKRLAALAPSHGVRLIALNSRGYPGSVPFSADERAALARASNRSPEGREEALEFMRERARELHDHLVEYVQAEKILPAKTQVGKPKGGIVLAGWSYGALWMLNFLAHAPSFRPSAVPLSSYIHRVVAYDGPAGFFGYSPIAGAYHAARDPDASPEERIRLFHQWVSSYFTHGEPISPETIMATNQYKNLPSTVSTMDAEDRAELIYEAPGKGPHGSDNLIQRMCLVNGVCGIFRERVLYGMSPASPARTAQDPSDDWSKVELRVVFGDRSVWPMVLAAYMLGKELEDAERTGRGIIRKVSVVRLRGGNHFAHWDYPEETMKAFIGDEIEVDVSGPRRTKAML